MRGGSGIGGDSAIDIGGGFGGSGIAGDNGQGIKPSADGTYTVYGDLILPCDISIPDGATVTIPEGASLTVPDGTTLTNNGTIQKDGGSFINDGTVTGQRPADDRYAINYAAETITIAEGYEVYTAATGGTRIQSGGSITAYIGKSLYIQKADSTVRTEVKIPARPQAPITASIDYAQETITSPPGTDTSNWEYSTDSTAWNDVPSGMALSEMGWDGSTAKAYYFRSGATDTSFASSATAIPIIARARPAKPADPTTLEVTSDSVTIEVVSGQEYRLGPSGTWETLTGATGSGGKTVHTYANLTPGTSYTIETRTPADGNLKHQFASHPASAAVTTERADSTLAVEPDEDTLTYGETLTVKVTPSIATSGINTLTAAQGTVELYNGDKLLDSTSTVNDDGSYTLTYSTQQKGMAVGSNTLAVSYGGSDSLNPSTAEVSVTLEKAMVNASLDGTTSKVYDGTADAPEGLAIAFTGVLEGDDVTAAGTIAYDTKDVGDGKTITATGITLTGTDAAYYSLGSETASVETGSIAKATPALSLSADRTSLSGGGRMTLTVGGVPDGGAAEVACDNGITVTDNGDGTWVADLPNTTADYTFTAAYAGDANHNAAQASCTVSVTRYTPSYNPPAKSPSQQAIDKIEGAEDGDTVKISLRDGNTKLDKEVFEALAGRDVTLEVGLDGGVAWSVHGSDIPKDAVLTDIDMGVSMDAGSIPADLVNMVTGERGAVQLDLAHDGGFGFAMTLIAPLGEESDGLYANLYHYDEGAGVLRYECSDVVDGGVARLRLDHASQWAIALDSRSHALPFADAGEGEWYSEAVRWAWLSGVMTGYEGSDSFGPGDELTRAQMASVLYRAAGSPGVEVSGLPGDCDASAWYAGCVAWALEAGVFEGYGDGSAFGPDDPLTREQAACVLMRAAAATGADTSARADLSSYPDAGGASGWAANALSWAVAEGVLSGVELPDGTRELQPGRACTRAEMAALMMNLSARATE